MKKFSKIALIVLLISFLTSCELIRKNKNTSDLRNTKWIYSDKDWSYEVYFMNNGKLATTHPNDNTIGNDFWKQNMMNIFFDYNDKYSVYEGKLICQDTITGIGKNQNEEWEFKMIRK